ncbi:histidine phosphatase family protein [Nitrospira sp. M1]
MNISGIGKQVLKFLIYMLGTFIMVLTVHISADEKFRDTFFRFISIVSHIKVTGIPVPSGMPSDVFAALRQGGYTIFIRHSERDKDVENRSAFERFALKYDGGTHPTFKRGSCLTEEGKAEAWLLGQVFQKSQIPIDTVYASPTCRTQETAQLAFGRIDVIEPSLNYQGTKTSYVEMGLTTKEEKELADQHFRKLIYALPHKGTNKVIVAHAGQFRDVQGFEWQSFRLQESGVLIIKHESENMITPITRATLEELVYALPQPSH